MEISQLTNDKLDLENVLQTLMREKNDHFDQEARFRAHIEQIEMANRRLHQNIGQTSDQNDQLILKVKKLELKIRQLQMTTIRDLER